MKRKENNVPMSLFTSLDSIKEIESAPVGVTFSSLEYTNDSFLKNIKDGTFSIAKIKSIIAASPELYFNYDNFKNTGTRTVFQELWTNERFLESVRSLFNTDQAVLILATKSYRRDINKIAYDYYCVEPAMENLLKDIQIMEMLSDIANSINMIDVIRLSAKMPQHTAQLITMFYYGTFDKMEGIERLHDFLMEVVTSYTDIKFDIDKLIYIYYIFFADGISDLFNALMIRKIPEDSEIKKHFYNICILAILNILNSMPSAEIKKVLIQYSGYLTLTGKTEVRTSLKALPEAYKRIAVVVKECNDNGYFIP